MRDCVDAMRLLADPRHARSPDFAKFTVVWDTAESGGHLFVPETFRVVLTSSFSPDVYEAHLGASLPDLETRVQPIVLFELSDAEREAQGLPALAPNDSQGVHPDAAGPVLGMAEAMSHWGDAKPMQFAKGELD